MTTVAEPTKKAKKMPSMDKAAEIDRAVAEANAKIKANAKPGDPDFDWLQEYPDEDVFVFTASTGITVGLAAAAGDRKLKPGDFRKMSHMEPWAQNFYLIEKVSCPKALEISDNLDDADYAAMMQGWTEWSGSSVGES